jgi:hypothetical protein
MEFWTHPAPHMTMLLTCHCNCNSWCSYMECYTMYSMQEAEHNGCLHRCPAPGYDQAGG